MASPSTHCRVALALLASFGASAQPGPTSQAPQATVHFQLRGESPLPEVLAGQLRLLPTGAGHEEVVVALDAKPSARASLPMGSRWLVVAEVPGWWARPTPLVVSTTAPESAMELTLLQGGQVRGIVELKPPGKTRAAAVSLGLEGSFGPARGRRVPPSFARCPLDPAGRFSCQVPAGRLDLNISVDGFAPHHRWDVTIVADQTFDLGRVGLRAGASVAGRIELEDGSPLPPGCRVTLEPQTSPGGADPALSARIKAAAPTATPAPTGFFQLAGLSAGVYSLTAEAPGMAPTEIGPLEVWEGRETLLREPLVLARPKEVEVTIEPALDSRGRPWQVRAHWASAQSLRYNKKVYEGRADESGRVLLVGLGVGRLSVQVADSAGNPMAARLDHPVSGSADDALAITIDAVLVQGTVSVGREKPVAGTLWLGGKHGALSFKAESDAEGRFSAVVPRQGVWAIEVEGREPKLSVRTKTTIEANKRGVAEVHLQLPETRVFGRVVDEEGKRVGAARVSFSPEGETSTTTTGEDGSFEQLALEPGRFLVSASGRVDGQEASMPGSLMVLAEGQELGPLELRLEANKNLMGWLESDRGAVVGASVRVQPLKPVRATGRQARSALDGSFSTTIPKRSEVASLLVSAPGHALKVFEVVTDGTALRLRLPLEGGRLLINTPHDTEALLQQNWHLAVFQNQILLPQQVLWEWARGNGTWPRVEDHVADFPRLAEGYYHACLLPFLFEEWELAPYLLGQKAGCASGYLAEGGELRLELRLPADN